MKHLSRRPALVALGSALALAAGGLFSIPAGAAADAPAALSTRLVASHSALCLGESPAADDAGLTQQKCVKGAAAQQFTLTATSRGYSVQTADGCLKEASRSEPGKRSRTVSVGTCPASSVKLVEVPGMKRAYRVKLPSSRCLEIYQGSTAVGGRVNSYPCGDPARAGHQVFLLDGSPAALPAPTPAPSGPGQPPTGTNPLWGKEAPPAGASLSRAYQTAVAVTPKGYQPKAGECASGVHARYWTYGPDGKVYPTWHPAKDPSGCSFGHEHGDDPRTSDLSAALGLPPFGYTNEQLAPSNPASQRNEDHVGHKVAVQNGVLTHPGNDPSQPADMRCSTLIKVHMGTHSPDALTNNLHEVFYNARCTQLAAGTTTEAHVQVLLPIGHPGSVNVTNTCDGSGTTVHQHVGPASPADSPDGEDSSRRVADRDCAQSVQSGQGTVDRMNEFWQLELHVRDQEGLGRLDLNPYLTVANPARYYDPTLPNLIGRTIDVCYAGGRGASCDEARAVSAQQGGSRVAFDDVRSPFNGSERRFDGNRFYVQNTGPTTLYSDVFGSRFTATPFPGAIKQYVAGNQRNDFGGQGDIFQPMTDYSPAGSGVRAPN